MRKWRIGAEQLEGIPGRATGEGQAAQAFLARRLRWKFGRAVPPLAAALVGALLFAGLSDGGRAARQAQPLLLELDKIAVAAGLGIDLISLQGHRFTADKAIFDALQLTGAGSTLTFDSEAARRRIEALPWIAHAVIERRLPSGLDVRVVERRPFARWIDDGRTTLIDATGRVLTDITPGAAQHLPQVSGADAPQHSQSFLAALAAHPDLVQRLQLAERVGARRWRLHLGQGLVVELPESADGLGLNQLVALQRSVAILDRGLGVVDLRLPNRVGIRNAPIPRPDPIELLLRRNSTNGA